MSSKIYLVPIYVWIIISLRKEVQGDFEKQFRSLKCTLTALIWHGGVVGGLRKAHDVPRGQWNRLSHIYETF